jgi:poly(3-hydroxybutyrate) depolymerase
MKGISRKAIIVLLLLQMSTTYGQPATLELKKASNHPIQYYVSLPANWSSKSKWPVVIVLEAAEKQFKTNAERFITARKDMPFIIVAPFITTNGQQGHNDPSIYPYSPAVWDTINKVSICKFDINGLRSIINDVKKDFFGSDKVFITGFEAGTHLVWAMIFQHPELLSAAAPVAGNYRSRCMENNSFSNDDSRTTLPIKNFTGSNDKDFGPDGRFHSQYLEGKNLALSHRYKNISETEVPGKAHVPLPEEVLNYFNSIWKSIKK